MIRVSQIQLVTIPITVEEYWRTSANSLRPTVALPTHKQGVRTSQVRSHTLQHTATHCNTLQHTVTSCNALQHVMIVQSAHKLGVRTSRVRPHTHCVWIHMVNPKSTSNQSSKPCTVLQYPSRKVRMHTHVNRLRLPRRPYTCVNTMSCVCCSVLQCVAVCCSTCVNTIQVYMCLNRCL